MFIVTGQYLVPVHAKSCEWWRPPAGGLDTKGGTRCLVPFHSDGIRSCRSPVVPMSAWQVRRRSSTERSWTIAPVRERGGVIRNRTNWISGWILALGVPAFVIGVADPLATHTFAADGGGWNPFMLAVTGGAAVLSVAGYILFARPMIVLGATHVRVRNPLSDRVFARSDITDAKRGLMYPRVVVEGRPIRLMALEQSNWQAMQGAPAQRGIVATLGPKERDGSLYVGRHEGDLEAAEPRRTRIIDWSPSSGRRAWVSLDGIALALAGLWLVYVVVGWIVR